MKRLFLVFISLCLMMPGAYAQTAKAEKPVNNRDSSWDIEKYLHKDAKLGGVQTPKEAKYSSRSLEEAFAVAIQYLEKKGAGHIQICESRWIIAPFSAYFIEGKCKITIDGKKYSIFHLGVSDGPEAHEAEVFDFIAMGKDAKGNNIWYPETGQDFQTGECEFLDREDFKTLEERYK